ncbi:MAG: acetamidase/formamidase family protein [Woeseiaceae bacterium]|nr:acetamidase/formamidase family protein [Woeseiaceae bacterium]
MNSAKSLFLLPGLCLVLLAAETRPALSADIVVLGGEGMHCGEDPHCINRLHPDIPMAARAAPGDTIILKTRNASDRVLDPESNYVDTRSAGPEIGPVHPLTGPVHIEGAKRGDVIAVTILDIAPGPYAYTSASSFGFASDLIGEDHRILWRLDRRYATSEDLPGIRVPNGAFPGVVTTLPGGPELDAVLTRESALAAVGGTLFLPDPTHASPAGLCGPDGRVKDACLRTLPPREHGGNMDIRYLGVGVTVYLPCFVDGCGLAVGDLHYAQGDGEVAGTAIEMDAEVTLVTKLLKDGRDAPDLTHGPHYEGSARLLDIPSQRFYAVTGLPVKAKGTVPPDMRYLESGTVAELENLHKDINLAARNALDAMVDYIVATYGYSRVEAYIIASVAVDLRIGQLVDSPNVGVTAILPLDIFIGRQESAR